MCDCKKIAYLLIIGMLAGMTACGGDVPAADTTVGGDVTTADTVPAETVVTDDLPDNLDFGGKVIRVLDYDTLVAGSDDGDLVRGMVYKNNLAVEERLNIEFDFIQANHYSKIPEMVRQSVNAGDDVYDIVFCPAMNIAPTVNEGLYLTVSSLDHIDLDKPYWKTDYMKSVSVNSKDPTILYGDICYNYIERLVGTIFNKQMLNKYCGLEATELYQMVLDGKWTLDQFTSLTKDVYVDLNGNSTRDEEDQFAILQREYFGYDWLAFSSGLEFTERDADGWPMLNMNTKKTSLLVDKLNKLFINNESVMSMEDNHGHVQRFADGDVLFLINRLYTCGWDELRQMEDDFGIVPTPKLDETIDNYHSATGNLVAWGVVPITVSDTAMISAVCEVLASGGYRDVTPVYYETALKIKYSRDDMSSQMIDLITENCRTDFLFLNSVGGLGKIFQELWAEDGSGFASKYASKESSAKTELAALIKTYNAK